MKITPLATPPPAARIGSFAIPHTFSVDRAAGVLSDLQLMAAGREAKGHGIYIDERTLETGHEVIAARGGRLKGYATHNHGGPGTWYWEQDKSELDVAGFFSAVSVAKSQLVAGRFEFFDTYKVASKDEYERMMEIAAKTPELLGLSVEVWGYVVYVGADGVEYSQRPDDIELANESMPTLRVTDLWAAAFCSDGAATDGLFAKLGAKVPAGVRDFMQTLAAFFSEQKPGADKTPVDAAPHSIPSALRANESSPKKSAMHKTIESIKAKFGADKARFSQAMTILGNTPDITIEALEAEMVRVDLTAARTEITTLTAQITTLTTERDAARQQVSSLTAERDDFKTKFEGVKKSGHPGVNLTAPTGSAAFTGANPWAKDSINLTAQAELLRSDPARAAALKAEAAAPGKPATPPPAAA